MDKLPDAVLRQIMSYVGNGSDFLSCERSCRSFYNILKDDSIWATCYECQPEIQDGAKNRRADVEWPVWPTSNREKVFVARALRRCRLWQGTTSGVIRSCMGVTKWKLIVFKAQQILSPTGWYPRWSGCRHFFHLRGDSSAVLMALVEQSMVSRLERARRVAFHRMYSSADPSVSFPSVSVADF